MKLSLPFYIFLIQLNYSFAQQFEYALTQPEYIGSEMNDVVPYQGYIYIAGGMSWCHQPAIWQFDTSGNLINTFNFSSEGTYGSIQQLLIRPESGEAIVLVNEKTKFDQKSNRVSVIKLDRNFEVQDVHDFPELSNNEKPQSAVLTDSSILILAHDHLHIYDHDFIEVNQIKLEDPIQNEAVILLRDEQIIYYDALLRNTIYNIDYQGNLRAEVHAPVFDQLVIYQDFIFISKDNRIIKYDLQLLSPIEETTFDIYESMELQVINEGFLVIIGHRENAPSTIAYYDENLKIVLDEKITPEYERNFRGAIDSDLEIFQTSSYRRQWPIPQNEYSSQDFLPVIRKKHIISPLEIQRPSMAIENVELLNTLEPFHCDTSHATIPYCVFSSEYLTYAITIKNSGTQTINNFGYYTNNVENLLCYFYTGYHYVDNINLEPGGTITIIDSMQLHTILNFPNLEFYIVAPNHIISNIPTSTFSFEQSLTSSRERHWEEALNVFPNPVSDILGIQRTLLKGSRYKIFDWTGRNVRSGQLSENELDVSDLPEGTYTL
ncbi:MAG: T9SS type A sorting domain-containing protein [Saprospiraceae bacterium]|nr:T9SS type A sorting domain-containing protein [Saprospiraceae bacterium]